LSGFDESVGATEVTVAGLLVVELVFSVVAIGEAAVDAAGFEVVADVAPESVPGRH
jgi:hypothetical protein